MAGPHVAGLVGLLISAVETHIFHANMEQALAHEELADAKYRGSVETARVVAPVVREEWHRCASLVELEHRTSARDRDLGDPGREPGVEGGRERFGHGGYFGKGPCCHVRGRLGKARAAPRGVAEPRRRRSWRAAGHAC
jgi:hypothetical protein